MIKQAGCTHFFVIVLLFVMTFRKRKSGFMFAGKRYRSVLGFFLCSALNFPRRLDSSTFGVTPIWLSISVTSSLVGTRFPHLVIVGSLGISCILKL